MLGYCSVRYQDNTKVCLQRSRAAPLLSQKVGISTLCNSSSLENSLFRSSGSSRCRWQRITDTKLSDPEQKICGKHLKDRKKELRFVDTCNTGNVYLIVIKVNLFFEDFVKIRSIVLRQTARDGLHFPDIILRQLNNFAQLKLNLVQTYRVFPNFQRTAKKHTYLVPTTVLLKQYVYSVSWGECKQNSCL